MQRRANIVKIQTSSHQTTTTVTRLFATTTSTQPKHKTNVSSSNNNSNKDKNKTNADRTNNNNKPKLSNRIPPTSKGTPKDKLLFTPGPLSTSLTVKEAMLHDLGSRDIAFIRVIKLVRRYVLKLANVLKSVLFWVILGLWDRGMNHSLCYERECEIGFRKDQVKQKR